MGGLHRSINLVERRSDFFLILGNKLLNIAHTTYDLFLIVDSLNNLKFLAARMLLVSGIIASRKRQS